MTFDVRISKAHTPKFPAACIRCAAMPTTSVKIREDSVGWWSVIGVGRIYGMLTGRGYDVPACESCARRIKNDRWKRKLVELVLVAIGVGIGFWVFRDWEGIKQRLAVVTMGILVALPWLMFEQFYPLAINITVAEDTVTFHFADEDYANEFAEHNPAF